MKRRIVTWMIAGFLVAGGWALYFLSANKQIPIDALIYFLACLTQPIVFLFRHFAVSVYWVLLANAATYALAGFIVETLRRKVTLTK